MTAPAVLRTKELPLRSLDFVLTRDHGFAVLGVSGPKDAEVATLLRLDPRGEQVWLQTYDEYPTGWIASLAETMDGGFVAAGSTAPWAAQEADACLLRVDASGNRMWSKRYGGRGPDLAASVIATREGDYVASGLTTSLGAGKSDFYLLRVDPFGVLLWEKAFGAETWEGTHESGAKVLQTLDGGFVLVGSTDSKSLISEGSSVAIYIVRTDGAGNLIWQRTFGTSGAFDVGTSIVERPEGGFVVAGTRHNLMNGLRLLEISDRGDLVWEQSHQATDVVGHVALVPLASGGYVLGNRVWASGGRGSDSYFVGVDRHGNKLWEKRLGGSGYHRVMGIVRDGDADCVALCVGPEWKGYMVWLEAR